MFVYMYVYISLSDFYVVGQGNQWRFQEPKGYLHHVGALDEGDLRRPSVVIPNYVYGTNNCLASSSLFSVCCTNECERLMSHWSAKLRLPWHRRSASQGGSFGAALRLCGRPA